MRNRALTEDIRDYWGLRAETYDASPGHGAMTPREEAAWGRLMPASPSRTARIGLYRGVDQGGYLPTV